MDIQTTETITEITQRYELYKDIVKIGLGALIGASASLIAVFMKNNHEINKLEKEYNNQSNKHKLEIKVKILEECIELTNTFFNVEYKLINSLYRTRFSNKLYKDLSENDKKEIANTEEFARGLDNISNAIRKFKMIGAKQIADYLHDYCNFIIGLREDILMSRKLIAFSDSEWNKFRINYTSKKENYDSLLHLFLNELK